MVRLSPFHLPRSTRPAALPCVPLICFPPLASAYQAVPVCIKHPCTHGVCTSTCLPPSPPFVRSRCAAGMTPLVISEKIPFLYENAMVIGYPMGGDNVCVTRGVVSRVTTLPYEDTKFFLPNQVRCRSVPLFLSPLLVFVAYFRTRPSS